VRTLCFGEAIVDLICQSHVRTLSDADAFAPHLGGVAVNVAVTAARSGAQVALAGGAGADGWGEWLLGRIGAEHVDLDNFKLVEGRGTGVAFVTVDGYGEPSYELHGDGMVAATAVLRRELLRAVERTDALFLGSNTLAGKAEAALTMRARDRALELDHPIVLDPNIRLGRWDGSSGRAGAASGACVPGAFLVKCNHLEARMMTGEAGPEAAAASLLAAGAKHVIITLGPRGAILRGGDLHRDIDGFPARVVSTAGAGDVFMGVILARLGTTDYYPSALAAALPDAVEEAALACRRWGALE